MTDQTRFSRSAAIVYRPVGIASSIMADLIAGTIVDQV